MFRVPKLGASFYLAQGDPTVRPVIEPNFYWDFGPQTPHGPGRNVAIFSNCDRLEAFIDGQRHATLRPDSKSYPHLKHPPFFVDLELDGTGHPELRLDGYVGDEKVLSRSFSSDPAYDQFLLEADDVELTADGADATRVVFRVTDRYGANRPFAGGHVALTLQGPGIVIGDNPFDLKESGGVGAVWIKSKHGKPGTINLTATHSSLGSQSVEIKVNWGNMGFLGRSSDGSLTDALTCFLKHSITFQRTLVRLPPVVSVRIVSHREVRDIVGMIMAQ